MAGPKRILMYAALALAGVVTGGVIDTVLLGRSTGTIIAPFSIVFGGGVPAYYWYLDRTETEESAQKRVLTGFTVILGLLAVGIALKSIFTAWSPVVL